MVLKVFLNPASENSSALVEVAGNVSVEVVESGERGQKVRVETSHESYGTMRLPLAGAFQRENLGCAIAGLERLQDELKVWFSSQTICSGVEQTKWVGRFEVAHEKPSVVVDGAHNPAASRMLAAAISDIYGRTPVYLIVGMCSDKDVRGFLKPWRGVVESIWAVDINNERNYGGEELARTARALGFRVEQADLKEAATQACFCAADKGVVCVTGSLYLAGEFLALPIPQLCRVDE